MIRTCRRMQDTTSGCGTSPPILGVHKHMHMIGHCYHLDVHCENHANKRQSSIGTSMTRNKACMRSGTRASSLVQRPGHSFVWFRATCMEGPMTTVRLMGVEGQLEGQNHQNGCFHCAISAAEVVLDAVIVVVGGGGALLSSTAPFKLPSTIFKQFSFPVTPPNLACNSASTFGSPNSQALFRSSFPCP